MSTKYVHKQNTSVFKMPTMNLGMMTFLGEHECARILGVSQPAVYKWIKADKIFTTRINGRKMIPVWAMELKARQRANPGEHIDTLDIYKVITIRNVVGFETEAIAWNDQDLIDAVKKSKSDTIKIIKCGFTVKKLTNWTPNTVLIRNNFSLQYYEAHEKLVVYKDHAYYLTRPMDLLKFHAIETEFPDNPYEVICSL